MLILLLYMQYILNANNNDSTIPTWEFKYSIPLSMDIIMLANISLVTMNEGESNFKCIESAALKMDKRSLISWHMLLKLV